MNKVKALLLLLLVALVPAADAAEAAQVSLLYNGSVRAELHDCGCKKLPLGGLARRAALIGEISTGREVLLVDAGNLMGDPTRDTLAQSHFVAAHTAALGYSAAGVGPYEFGHGIDAVLDLSRAIGLPFLSANLAVDGERPFESWTVVERGGIRFGLISVVDPGYDRAPYNARTAGLEIEDPTAALQRELPRLREAADVVVLLSNMEKSEGTMALLRSLGDEPGIEFVIEGSASRHYPTPLEYQGTAVLAANARGKYLGQVDLEFDAEGVHSFTPTLHALSLELPEDPEVAREVAGFEAAQSALTRSR